MRIRLLDRPRTTRGSGAILKTAVVSGRVFSWTYAIAVTACASVRERDEALAAGVTLLARPVDPDQLAAAVSGIQRA